MFWIWKFGNFLGVVVCKDSLKAFVNVAYASVKQE